MLYKNKQLVDEFELTGVRLTAELTTIIEVLPLIRLLGDAKIGHRNDAMEAAAVKQALSGLSASKQLAVIARAVEEVEQNNTLYTNPGFTAQDLFIWRRTGTPAADMRKKHMLLLLNTAEGIAKSDRALTLPASLKRFS